jgi:hypothetical protein
MSHSDHGQSEVRFERTDVDAWAVLHFGFWLLVITFVTTLLVAWLFGGLARHQASLQPPPPVLVNQALDVPPLPHLQIWPARDLASFRKEEALEVSGYGWVDREKGLVRIPVDRAIEVLAERGLPARPAPAEAGR